MLARAFKSGRAASVCASRIASTRKTFLVTSVQSRCFATAAAKLESKQRLEYVLHRSPEKKNLVILGTGWAGFRICRSIDMNQYNVTVVSPRNHFLFTPLLPSTTTGTLEFRSIIEPIRTVEGLSYLQAKCVDIDTENNLIKCRDEFSDKEFDLDYDDLVVSVGARNATFNVPGVEPDKVFFLRNLEHARALRNRIIENFERASNPFVSREEARRLLTFVIVGGGPTSVEFAAELHDFVTQDVAVWYPDLQAQVRMELLEAGPQLLSAFDRTLRDYTLKTFRKRNVMVRLGTSVEKVTDEAVYLSDGDVIPSNCIVWSTGNSPTPLIENTSFPTKQGRLVVDDHLRIKDNVFALGDCAVTPDNLPPTAQVAQQEGAYLAKLLNAKAKGKMFDPAFNYSHRGMMAYVGEFRALASIKGTSVTGFGGWFLWRSAYLTQLMSWKNKMLVPMFWLKSFIFGRDISRF